MSGTITLVNLVRSDRPGERLLPLGCLALRAALEQRGHEVELRDVQQLPGELAGDPDQLAPLLDDSAPVLGLSLMVDALPLAVALCRRLAERRPERLLILGGPGPTAVSLELVRTFPWIDLVVRGEGEQTLTEVMDALDRSHGRRLLEQIPGLDLAPRDGRPALSTPDRPLIADLDQLPRPRLDDLNLEQYSYYTTVASRGCPHRCSFCEIHSRQQGRLRLRSVARVVEEIRTVRERYGVRFVAFQDDHFLHRRARTEQLFTTLQDEGLSGEWACFARVDEVDRPWLAHLRDSFGLQHISFGLEAGSDFLLSCLNKGFTLRRALEGLRAATGLLPTTCFFMWGFPQERLVDFFGTAQAIHHAEYLGATVQVGQVVPLAGSELYRRFGSTLQQHTSYPFCRIVRLPVLPELQELVLDHPRLFPAFASFATEDAEQKWQLAGRLCCR